MFQHFLKRTVRPLFYVPPKPVGRWNIHKQNDSLYLNNYYSNIDHCGDKICGIPKTDPYTSSFTSRYLTNYKLKNNKSNYKNK